MYQKTLGQKVGVSLSAVSNWESGRSSVDLENFFKICDVLQCSADELAGRSAGVYLSAEDREILDAYHKTDDTGKGYVRGALHLPENEGGVRADLLGA